MSSDVYLDILDSDGELVVVSGLGHLGTMSYFGVDLVKRLHSLCSKFPIITEELIYIVKQVCGSFQEYVETVLKPMDPELFTFAWGYTKPGHEPPTKWYTPDPDVLDSYPTPEDTEEMMRPWIGYKWDIRVD